MEPIGGHASTFFSPVESLQYDELVVSSLQGVCTAKHCPSSPTPLAPGYKMASDVALWGHLSDEIHSVDLLPT